MAAPQQPPPQPIYPRDLTLALDRVFTRFVEYANSNNEALAAQMRIGFAESYARDDALLKRIESSENTQRVIIDTLTTLASNFTQAIDGLRAEMREGFAAQAERHNELMVRVERLERNSNPPSEAN